MVKKRNPSKEPTLFSLEEGARKLKKSVIELIELSIKYNIHIFAIVSEMPMEVAHLSGNMLRRFTLDPSTKISVGDIGILYYDYDFNGGVDGKEGFISELDDDKKITMTIEGLRITEWELNRLKEAIKKNKIPIIEKGKLKRGEKKPNIPENELIPFVKQNLKYLRSPKGGKLRGGALAERMSKDISKIFSDKYGEKAKYKPRTINNLISKIDNWKK